MSQFGGFWVRVLAYIIDAIIVNVAVSLVGFVLGVGMSIPMTAAGSDAGTTSLIAGFAGSGLGFIGSWLYFALLESSARQATVGKMALGLVVTDENGGRISFGRATGRYFAKIISGMILLIGFMMVGWTARKQGLHDLIASTLVYKSRDPSQIGVNVDAFR